MSAIKNHFHEEICKAQDDMIDDSYQHDQWKKEQKLKEEAEKAEFFRIFELTGTYPM
jgi:hypothetical protein